MTLQYEGETYDITLRSAAANYAQILNFDVARGSFFTEADYNGRSRVVVLGPETASALFPDDVDPLGAEIKIGGLNFRVIGLFAAKGASSFGPSQDDIAVIPLTTAQDRLFNTRSRRNGEFLADAILMHAVDDTAVDGLIIDASNARRVKTIEVLDAMYRSAASGRMVAV